MGRVFWAVLFWIWGFGGLVIFGIERFVVGDPADITSELFWIGGMVLFGLSALMGQPPD
jgi:hypothetical protein